MSDGELTARIANSLQKEFEKQEFDVLHDHRFDSIDAQGKLGKLRIWFGEGPKRETLLADLDIAIISPIDKKVILLIEIEETTDKPKVILGDVLAILLGNGITIRNKKSFKIGTWTTLIVMSYNKHSSHQQRNQFLIEKTNSLKSSLDTDNASIGQVLIDNFMDENQLETKIKNHVDRVINRFRK